MKLPPKLPDKSNAAFTLIELLVVITIIAILAGLIMPVMGMVQRSSSRSVTASNLRQIAVAIAAYAGDNDAKLPGPLNVGQGPRYSTMLSDTLGFKLYKYLGGNEPTASIQENKILSNPAYERYRQTTDSPSYAVNQRTLDANGVERKPWGYAGESDPLTLSNVATWSDNAQLWAMQDVDQLNVAEVTGTKPSWYSQLPKTPVHGDVRMTLFFDWHVQPVPVPKK